MEQPPAEIDEFVAGLTEDEVLALAALAVVGKTTLAPEAVARLAGASDAARAIENLRLRGLLDEDENGHTGPIRSIAGHIRRTEAAIATGERLLDALTTLARADRIGAAEIEAILNLTGWAAETGRWRELLELVETVESVYAFADRVEQRIWLLERGVEAAREVGDTAAEARLLAKLGGTSPVFRRSSGEPGRTSLSRMLVRTGALAVAGGVGLAAGYVLPHADAGSTATVPVTATLPVTIVGPGTTAVSLATITDQQTVTTPPETVTVTTTVTETGNGGVD